MSTEVPLNVCNISSESRFNQVAFSALEGTLAGIGIALCATSLAAAVALKLYKQLVYRLAIYQVSSALAFGVACILGATYRPLIKFDNTYFPICLAAAFIAVYSSLVKLFVTLMLTVHLFIFAVCHRNLKRLEMCYVITAFVVPALMAVIPFMTHTYGIADKRSLTCSIMYDDGNCIPNFIPAGFIELYVLWFGPAVVCLSSVTLLILVMLSVLAFRACKPSAASLKNRTAIRQMLPLMAYPVTFCAFVIFSMIPLIYDSVPGTHSKDSVLIFIALTAVTGYVWSAGLAFLVHICVMMRSTKKSISKFDTEGHSFLNPNNIVHSAGTEIVRSSTYFSIETESDVSELKVI